MDRRAFSTAALSALGWPLLARSAQAQGQPSAPPPRLTASELAAKIDGVYGPLQSFGATFEQRYGPSYARVNDSLGTVLFEQPGKMRWRYTRTSNLVIADGQTVKVYEKASKRLFVVPPGKSQYPAALSFVNTPGGLASGFDLNVPQAARAWNRQGYVLSGQPKQPSATFAQVLWFVAAGTFEVRRVVVVDAQGNRNRIDFDRAKKNPNVPAGSFTFTPPPGTQITT